MIQAYEPLGRSALARQLAELPQGLRATLDLTDAAILLVDLSVSLAAVLTDQNDERPWQDRLTAFIAEFSLPPGGDDGIEQLGATIASVNTDRIPLWMSELGTSAGHERLRQLLNEDHYDRLRLALQDDLATVVGAIRRALQFGMPFALTLDNSVAPLSQAQLAQLPQVNEFAGSALAILVELHDDIGRHDPSPETADDRSLAELTADLQQRQSAGVRAMVLELSAMLSRKLQGARDAMAHSADPVSQAANSLIEFIDRLLRQAFDEQTVLAWINQNCRSDAELTYTTSSGTVRPTKRGEAMCFMYGGGPLRMRSPLHEAAVAGLIVARTALQRLKHADELSGSSEIEQVSIHLNAIEAYLVIAMKIGWLALDEAEVREIRERITPVRPDADSGGSG
ncbi:hypothetical protein JOF29_005716 [Kribbella aluminosa]|uniref:Uncharacterized protein n=1 Tax=Kribbella aluminosa TaxID=416017 RepID=A0ABS4USI2_9ACTN|nr:hypothetical protein [Kribbella aluminosa]MBP2354606.1 hypothetical protein [Kribbella aluminosa]